MTEPQTLLEFPCAFPIKAMGRMSDDFAQLVTSIVLEHASLVDEQAVTMRASGEGNFLSVTVTIEAESRGQLDDIYRALTACDQVLMAL